MSLRLCWRAPRTTSSPRAGRRSSGSGIVPLAAQVLAGEGLRSSRELCRRALRDDLAAVLAGAGAEVDDVVGGADRALVVLDHDHGVAEVPQPLERVDQLLVVALVEPDRGLVEDVEDAHERRADLGREPDPLRLTAGERVGRPLERQVADPDAVEEPQPLGDLAHDEPRDGALGVGQLQVLDPLEGRARRQLRVLVDVEPADRDREALRPQPGAVARRARLQRHQALDPLAGVVRVGVLVAPLEARQHAVEAHRVGRAGGRTGCGRRRCACPSGAVEQQLRGPSPAGPARGCSTSIPLASATASRRRR